MRKPSFSNLYKKIDATSKTRFHSARRLKLHSKYSTYIIILISLILILISLMQAYKLGNNIGSDLVGLIQVFSSVTILVYSLLIDKNNYSSLSEKMYSCASKLAELKIKIHPHREEIHNQDCYDKYSNEYSRILKLYETHSNNDFRGDYVRARLEMPEDYQVEGVNWLTQKAFVYYSYSMNFLSYFLAIGIFSSVLYWLWFGT